MTSAQLIAYSLKYEGERSLIAKAVAQQEPYQPVSGIFNAITILDDAYPECFKNLAEPPFVLYYKGDLTLLKRDAISVVGSRDVTAYAKTMTEKLIGTLSKHCVIVSGLAKGIDACAHEAGLSGLSTIAVLGCGIDRVYPIENKDLYLRISKKGLILSEYPGQASPLKHRFPWRNRLVAALGKDLVVMQADLKSGSMITVTQALNLGKDVYTIPYDLTHPEGRGCNLLIQQGAMMILSEDDLPII